jgi:glycosyltransferase involved in cell wall biosynthesis
MLENKIVSVVIPMYNAQNDILRCLTSVHNQTYKKLEVIVVNDGSKDNSESLVNEFMNKHPELKITLINKTNGGVSSARNTGLKLAKGIFIALLDSDDDWYPNKIETQLNLFNQYPTIDFLACNPIKERIDRFLFRKFGELNYIKVSDLIYKNYFQPSTVIFKREVMERVGLFDENQRYAEEGNYFMRIAHQYQCVLVNHKLIGYGQGKAGFGHSGLSGNIVEMEKGELKNLFFAHKSGFINVFQLLLALLFSLFKFSIRVIRVKILK